MKQALLDENQRHVVIVGAGFIGLELSEACRHYGKEVTVVELAEHVLPAFDTEISEALEAELAENGVTVRVGTMVQSLVEEDGRIVRAVLQRGEETEEIPADLVINSAGIAPATSFITNVEKARNGAICVNERMETSIPDVYAAGDCSIMKSAVTGDYLYAPLGTNANKQGRIIGDILGGVQPKPFKLIGSSALRLFGIDAAKVGLSEKEAKARGPSLQGPYDYGQQLRFLLRHGEAEYQADLRRRYEKDPGGGDVRSGNRGSEGQLLRHRHLRGLHRG